MATILPRRAGFVCHTCQKFSTVKPNRRQFISQVTNPPKQAKRTIRVSPRKQPEASGSRRTTPAVANTAPQNAKSNPDGSTDPRNIAPRAPLTTANYSARLEEYHKIVAHILQGDAAVDNTDVLEALMEMHSFASLLVLGVGELPKDAKEQQGDEFGDALLQDLAEDRVSLSQKQMPIQFRVSAAQQISELAYKLVRDAKVYISEPVLEMYVRIVCLLGKPEYLPEIFHLYAHKKIPLQGSRPVKYSNPWPKMPKYAVPLKLAEAALESAILKKNLPLALAIIETTVAAPAFRASKVVRKASGPGLIVGATPLVAYAGADWVSHWQNTMDVEMAKYTAIAGALAYIGTLTTIGFVALTTWNDQMQRVVWRPGTKLRDRWTREEERAFLDRLALAWGFQEKYRWGEEHGQDWQTLRDACGMRDMILDKTELMEGMQ